MQNNNLPDWWKIVKLKDYTTERKQKNKANEELTVFSISNKRWFVKSDDYFEWQVYSKDLKNYKIVKKWEFWFSPPRINVWSIAYMEEHEIWVISPIYVVFALKDWIDLNFFRYFMKWHLFNKQVNNYTQWAVRQNLSYDDFWKIELLLPPLEVQKEIAWKLNDLDKLIETQNNQIEKYEKLKKAMIKKLISEWIWHAEFKEDKYLGKIPKEWEVKKLWEIVSINDDTIWKNFDKNKSIKYVEISSVETWKIINHDEYIFKDSPVRARRIIKTWDLIISTVRPYLKQFVLISDKYNDFIVSTWFAVLRCRNYYNKFLFQYFLSQNTIDQINNFLVWVWYTAINTTNLKEIYFQIPKLEEQKKIADILENIDNLLEKEREIKEWYEKVKKWIVSLVFSCNLLIK